MSGVATHGAKASRPASGPVSLRDSPHARLYPLAFDEAEITGGMWGERREVNRRRLLPGAVGHLESSGNFDNLRAAAGQGSEPFRGPVFMDSDVYKWLEAVGWELGRHPDPELADQADRAIALIATAQQEDGYLNSYYQVNRPGEPFSNLAQDHELYCAGHLIQAAVAHSRALGDDRLVEIAERFVELIDATFRVAGRPGTPGHPEVETALVELYRLTGRRRHLELAAYFIDQRGHRLLGPGHYGPSYYQDHVPVREAREVTGHAVRALYLAAGVTDLYLETGEPALMDVMQAQWEDMVGGKTYLTGGLGAHHRDEAFGDRYELPPDRCYGETCAAIASIMWNWRMLLATGEGAFADLLERTLYNAFLVGLSCDGEAFAYVNPLQVREDHRDPVERGARRQPWYRVACCPPNVMRLLASLEYYLATADEGGVQLHQYAPGRLASDCPQAGRVALQIDTEYPWQGQVAVRVSDSPSAPWELALRIPGWSPSAELTVNGESVAVEQRAGYVTLRRAWRPGDEVILALDMTPRVLTPHPRIDAVRGCAALERGPLVYCIEQADLAAGVSVDDVRLDAAAPITEQPISDPVPGSVALRAGAVHDPAPRDPGAWPYLATNVVGPDGSSPAEPSPMSLTAIPYAFWGNRTPGPMRVWIPLAE
ncbi:MAG: glycoside hydrolase family 127 protein [Solirubrobacterales bacterium]|nr:glycoside hydrolase family 127 protein [Solirubrobacterales bacterium]